MIELKTLGGLQVHFNGNRLELPLKAAALLSVLAITAKRTVGRNTIAEWLWPKTRKPLHSLDQTLYTLRKHFGASIVKTTSGDLSIGAAIQSDYLTALELIRTGNVSAACKLVQGGFLEGVDIQGSDGFDDWRHEREAYLLSSLHTAVLLDLRAKRERHAWVNLNELAQEGVRLFADSNFIRTAAIESCLATGQVEEARRLHDDYVRRDGDQALADFEDIAATLIPASITTITPTRTLIGREKEIQTLSSLLDDVFQGTPRVAILRGNPGVGKTTVAEAGCEIACRRGAIVVKAKAHHTEQGIGYNLLAEILIQLKTHVTIEELPATFAEAIAEISPDSVTGLIVGELPKLGRHAEQRRLLEAVTHFVRTPAQSNPLVVMFDDVQWCDTATLEWLSFFARRMVGLKVMIIVTCRRTPDQPFVRELELMDHACSIPIDEFTEADVAALLAAQTAHRGGDLNVKEVFTATAGNALLVTEFLHAREHGQLSADEPRPLQGFLQREVNRLSAVSRGLLEALSVFGHPVPIRDALSVAAVQPLSIDEIWPEIDYFCGLVGHDSIKLRHDVVQETIYRTLSDRRRALLHARVAEVLKGHGASAGAVAEHLRNSGNRSEAHTVALEAAAASELAHAHTEASHFLQMAEETAASDRERGEIRGRLADLYFRIGRYVSAVPLLAEQIQLADRDPQVRLNWEWKHLRACASAELATPSVLAEMGGRLEKEAKRRGHLQAYFHGLYVQVFHCTLVDPDSDYDRAIGRLLEFAAAHPVTEEGTSALRMAGLATSLIVNSADGLTHINRAADWATRLKDAELEIMCLHARSVACYLAGQFENARAAHVNALSLVDRTGALVHKAGLQDAVGCLLMELGQTREAEVNLLEATRAEVRDESAVRGVPMLNQAILAWICKDYADAYDKAVTAKPFCAKLSWLDHTVIAVRGLSSLELGRTANAAEDADYLERNLADPFFSDVSLPCYLIARMASLRKREAAVIPLIRKRLADYQHRDYVCRQRLQLALAEVLARSNPEEALSLCKATIANAEAKGLVAVRELADTVQRRVLRVSRRL